MLTIGIDIGTTSTIGILVDTDGHILATARRESELFSEHPEWAEEDPAQWWRNTCEVIAELLRETGRAGSDVAAVGVTGMVPAVVLLDDEGNVLRRSIQQNDARTERELSEMRAEIEADDFFGRTGGSINQQLVAPKLRWLERHEPEVFSRIATVLGSYDFIAWRLTSVRSIEHNWALESGFMDLSQGSFDPALVALSHADTNVLPPIRPSHAVIGTVTESAAAQTGLSVGTPVVAGCADHVASAFVAGVVNEGDLLIKFGGAGDILLATDAPCPDPRLFIDYHIVPGLYLSNGCMAASGSVLKWIVREFGGTEQTRAQEAGESAYVRLDRSACEVPPGADGLILLPYFLGEKTPLHDPNARGTVVGLGLHHTLRHVWRAALEAVVFGFRHHLEVFAERGLTVRRVVASDGGSASPLWLEIAADIIGLPVQLMEGHPGSSLGAAYVAGIGVGAFDDWDGISNYVKPGRVFEPNAANKALYDHSYALYRETYERLKTLYPKLQGAP